MRNFACFNELSIRPLCNSDVDATQRVNDFLLVLRDARSLAGIIKVRHEGNMSTIPLTQSVTLMDYINSHTKDPAVIALLGIFIHPQVDMQDDESLQSYIDASATIQTNNGESLAADGFNAAYCQSTFCVGFDSDTCWKDDFFDLKITSNEKKILHRWACLSTPFIGGDANKVSQRKKDFAEWLQGINPVLINTTKGTHEKEVSLRPDHGKKELKEHAELLLQHEYVEGVLTSLPFKPKSKSYISNITDDGLVDVVLFWEDAGYSMRVKTTGRNAAETREIAKILKERFGRK